MSLTLLAAAAVEPQRHVPVPPIVMGLTAFVVLLLLMTGLLAFGKGRPHT
ncbi:MAG: hypothetical protein ACRDPG_06025 [Nocardioidaceae bacterium]